MVPRAKVWVFASKHSASRCQREPSTVYEHSRRSQLYWVTTSQLLAQGSVEYILRPLRSQSVVSQRHALAREDVLRPPPDSRVGLQGVQRQLRRHVPVAREPVSLRLHILRKARPPWASQDTPSCCSGRVCPPHAGDGGEDAGRAVAWFGVRRSRIRLQCNGPSRPPAGAASIARVCVCRAHRGVDTLDMPGPPHPRWPL